MARESASARTLMFCRRDMGKQRSSCKTIGAIVLHRAVYSMAVLDGRGISDALVANIRG